MYNSSKNVIPQGHVRDINETSAKIEKIVSEVHLCEQKANKEIFDSRNDGNARWQVSKFV